MEHGSSPPDPPPKEKAGYKSWKKKYRKMRISFEEKMVEAETLHRQEDQAQILAKRLALENDQLLDILLEINNSPQIPLEKRIDLTLPLATTEAALPIDRKEENSLRQDATSKRLEELLKNPHSSYSVTENAHPVSSSLKSDLQPLEGDTYPLPFLSADDIDNAFFQYDVELSHALDDHAVLPTLAPKAHPDQQPLLNLHLKNPVSVTNWLRKNAPKIFLQDGPDHPHHDEDDGPPKKQSSRAKSSAKDNNSKSEKAEKEHVAKKAEDESSHKPPPSSRASKSTPSAPRRKRPSKVRGGGGDDGPATPSAEVDAVKDKDKKAEGGGSSKRSRARDEEMEDVDESTHTPTAAAAKGKRKREDDPGYRPKGGSSRPTKKKRKSDGERKSRGGEKEREREERDD